MIVPHTPHSALDKFIEKACVELEKEYIIKHNMSSVENEQKEL